MGRELPERPDDDADLPAYVGADANALADLAGLLVKHGAMPADVMIEHFEKRRRAAQEKGLKGIVVWDMIIERIREGAEARET